MSLEALTERLRACRICEAQLDPRPVFRLHRDARILVIGQAPGSRVHETGRPWDDASGEHLVAWLGVDRATFDDPTAFAILPSACCYPGKGTTGDLPPPPVCADTWHAPLLAELPHVRLTLLVGQYAVARYVEGGSRRTLTATVRDFASHGDRFPLPHPSWRSRIWMAKHPWFAAEVLPALRDRVAGALT